MTDARAARYDELYPALDGLSGNSNQVDANTSLLNNNNNNSNNNAPNSWSAHTASGPQQQSKLNYIQQIQNFYQQQQQQQQQQQHQQQQPNPSQQLESSQQLQQQQVLDNLTENNSTGVVTQHHSLPQHQQQQQFAANNNSSLVNNNTMQNNIQPQQNQAKRPGPTNHPMLSERFCTFKIAPEERRHRDFELEQSRILKEIMQKTNTKIEVTTTKDGALNFCIIGKEYTLPVAKNLVLNDFQTGVTMTVSVPKAIHGRLLGQKGQRLATIQDETQTKITIPRKDEDSDIIKIVGLKSNAELAVRAIEKCAREFAGKAVEKVTVERIYILFITGPFNENLKRWEEMGAKVSTSGGLLPSSNDRESGHADEVTFTIIGEVTAVNQVKDEIVRIYEDKKKKCTTVNIEVKKAQHKYILGPAGQNLRQLFAKTGVSVELPHESESETITLRGERSKLAPALSELYTQAHSETDDYFEVESWLHKYLIGAKRTNFLDFKALGVDVKSLNDKIKLHGPPAEIENILDIFEAELEQLRKNIIRKDISVEARIHGYIIGRGGEKIRSIREKFSQVVFSFPELGSKNNELTIVGPSEEVEECYKYLDELIQQIQENNYQSQVPIKKEAIKYLPDAKQAILRLKLDHQVKIDLFINEGSASSAAAENQKKSVEEKEAPGAKTAEIKQSDDSKKKGAKNDGKVKKSVSNGTLPPSQVNGIVETQQSSEPKVKINESASGDRASNPENYAVIVGKKENVEAAKPKFVKLLEEFATTTEIEIKVASNLRDQLGPKSKLNRQFCDEFQGKITIVLPPSQRQRGKQQSVTSDEPVPEVNGTTAAPTTGKGKNKENKKMANKEQQQSGDSNNNAFEVVKIRGPKNVVKKAEKRFEALIAECHKNFTVRLNVDAVVYDKFLHNPDKLKLKEIRDELSVKLHIPDKREGVNKLVCTIVGYEKDVHEAQKRFERLMKDVAERIEETIEIPSQVHPRLIGVQGRAVKKLMEDHKVAVKFARPGDPNPNAVTLYGRQQNVNSAKSYMQKVANQFVNMVNRNANAATAAIAAGNEGDDTTNVDNNNGNDDENSQQKPQEMASVE